MLLLAAAGAGSGAACAAEADFPGRALRVIVPAVPGGGTDLVARIVGQKLAQVLTQAARHRIGEPKERRRSVEPHVRDRR